MNLLPFCHCYCNIVLCFFFEVYLSSFYVNFPRLRGLDGFPQVPCLHNARSLAVSFFRPHSSIVFFTSSSQVLTGRPAPHLSSTPPFPPLPLPPEYPKHTLGT